MRFEPRPVLIAALLIAIASLAAYAGTFGVPFQFDDFNAIVRNPTIRQLWPLSGPLSPPNNSTNVHGRPLVNLSLAINYAIGGTDVRSYHAFNLGLHTLSALLLFGIVRRTWRRQALGNEGIVGLRRAAHDRALLVAFAVGLLWAVHPLLTESVTGIIQRTEVMVGFFYLLTFYAFSRALDAVQSTRWYAISIFACLAGMATKEVMVTAPVLVLFFDRTFGAGSFREAWRQRRVFYVGLAATWLLLALLIISAPQRGGTVGFGLGVSSWSYLLTQCYAITLYLKLSVWPHPLVVDYGTWLAPGLGAVLPQALLIVALATGTLVALWRWPRAGFLGFWFFGILAPSSSFVPLATQTIAEHRMYLPSIAVVVVVALLIDRMAPRAAFACILILATGATVLTIQRNQAYATELTLWSDTVAKRPGNFRAHTTLGTALANAGRRPEAIAHFEESLRLQPDNAATRLNLSDALLKSGKFREAAQQAEQALRISPNNPDAHNNLANALVALGQTGAAITHYQAALQFEPDAVDIQLNLGAAFLQAEDFPSAIAHYREAAQLKPDRAETWHDLARAFEQTGDGPSARRAVERALQLKPEFPEALYLLGNLDAANDDLAAAIPRYRRALELSPDFPAAHNNLANALLLTGDLDEAIAHYQEILRQQPDEHSVRENLAHALELQRTGRRAP